MKVDRQYKPIIIKSKVAYLVARRCVSSHGGVDSNSNNLVC